MRFRICTLVVGTLILCGSHALAQSVTYNFSDNTSDGWANAGFSNTPLATVSNFGGTNYIVLPLGGFQVGNVGTGNASDPLFLAMQAAALNPAGYNLSYDYRIDTSLFTGAGFLQLGSFVNTGSGYYAQDFPGSNKEVELNGTQLSSGQVFTGHVSVNFAAVGFAMPTSPLDTFYRIGLIENGNGTGTAVGFTNISVAPVPEPSTLVLCGLGALGLAALRRRKK